MRMRLSFSLSFLFLSLLLASAGFGLAGPISNVGIPGTSAGTKTGIYILPGDLIHFVAAGQVNTLPPNSGSLASPDGNGSPCTASCLLPSAHFGTLIGRIGEQGAWFFVGSTNVLSSNKAGMLYLAVNDTIFDNNTGGFAASISISAGFAFCSPTADALCLAGNRFRVQAFWGLPDGTRGTGQVAPCGTSDSGLLWFFGPTNWEVLVKVLNACTFNQRYWVFAA